MDQQAKTDKCPAAATHWGARLKSRRRADGWSQGELAARSGVSQQTISAVECGEIASSREVVKLAGALRVTVEWLTTGLGDPEQLRPPPVDLERLPLAELMQAMAERLSQADPVLRETVSGLIVRYVCNPTEHAQIAELIQRLLPPTDPEGASP
jgi:transcriptional regulator with XRE-family HTH domain